MPLPESHEDELLSSVALSLIPGIGPRSQALLLESFQSATNVLQQSTQALLSVPGIGHTTAQRIVDSTDRDAAAVVLQECKEHQVSLLQKSAGRYPAGLRTVDDSPHLLYVRGTWKPQDELAVAIVGSRRCTTYGRRMAERFAGALVRAGFTIVSGLARGIDGAAHRGALNAGGRTIAVLATGVREIYPPEHADLALDIAASGALVSENPPYQKPRPGLFPQRNRIISGLSLGVIIIEATRKSGALYTARHAMEQGREVFALPGQVDSVASEGCHELIREGATLIRNVDDVMQELGPLTAPATSQSSGVVHHPREMTLNPQEQEVLGLVTTSPVHIDEILRATQLDMSRVLSTITVLEMKRFIRRLPGNMLVRNT